MVGQIRGDDPEPSERVPAGLLVPVRPGPSEWVARPFRTPPGIAVHTVDPRRAAPAVRPTREPRPRHTGVLSVTGTAGPADDARVWIG
jgi:hypothetical protein